MGFTCPSCSSDQVQKVSVIFESGTSQHVGHTTGTGVGIGLNGKIGVGFGGGTTRTTSKTALAQRLSPPAAPGGCGCLAVLLFFILGGLSIMFPGRPSAHAGENFFFGFMMTAAMAGLFVWKWKTRSKAQEEYPVALARWQRLWFCHTCGTTFEPKGQPVE